MTLTLSTEGGIVMRIGKRSILVKSNFLILTLALIVSIIIVTYAPPTSAAEKAQVFKWRAQHPWPPGGRFDELAQDLVARIKKRSAGRLDIKLFPAGAIVGTAESLDAIGKGMFEAHLNIPLYWSGKMHAGTFFFGAPGGIDGFTDWYQWYYNYGGLEMARDAYKKFNVYFVDHLTSHANTPIFARKEKPLRSLADFKGLKVRAAPGVRSDIIKALGAAPAFMMVGDVYTALETGVIDAVSGFSIDGWYKFGIHEISHWLVYPAFMMPDGNTELAVGMKAWNKLPADLQSLIKEVVRGWKVEWYIDSKQVNYKSLKAMTDAGLEIVNLPEKDIKELNKIVEDTVTKFANRDPLSKKVWASQKKFLSTMGKRK